MKLICMNYCLDDIIKIEDVDSDNVLIDRKLCKFICLYGSWHIVQIFNWLKPLHISFDKIHEFIRVYGGIRYLALFGPEIYDVIYDKIRYLINRKSGIKYIIFHNSEKVKIYGFDSFPLEKLLTSHNVIILIESIFNKGQNHYYFNIFSEK